MLFINFLSGADTRDFSKETNGYQFRGSASNKTCLIFPVHVQGLVNNLAAFSNNEVMHSERKPFYNNDEGPWVTREMVGCDGESNVKDVDRSGYCELCALGEL